MGFVRRVLCVPVVSFVTKKRVTKNTKNHKVHYVGLCALCDDLAPSAVKNKPQSTQRLSQKIAEGLRSQKGCNKLIEANLTRLSPKGRAKIAISLEFIIQTQCIKMLINIIMWLTLLLRSAPGSTSPNYLTNTCWWVLVCMWLCRNFDTHHSPDAPDPPGGRAARKNKPNISSSTSRVEYW